MTLEHWIIAALAYWLIGVYATGGLIIWGAGRPNNTRIVGLIDVQMLLIISPFFFFLVLGKILLRSINMIARLLSGRPFDPAMEKEDL